MIKHNHTNSYKDIYSIVQKWYNKVKKCYQKMLPKNPMWTVVCTINLLQGPKAKVLWYIQNPLRWVYLSDQKYISKVHKNDNVSMEKLSNQERWEWDVLAAQKLVILLPLTRSVGPQIIEIMGACCISLPTSKSSTCLSIQGSWLQSPSTTEANSSLLLESTHRNSYNHPWFRSLLMDDPSG